jgi:ribokinase
MRRAQEKGMQIALNPSPIDENLKLLPLEAVTYFLLNEVEGNELTDETEPETIAVRLHEKFPAARIVLTLGKQGVLYYDGGEFVRHGIYPTKVVDTTAAGDTFTGFFLSSVLQGKTVATALELASKASSIAVSIKGAANSIPTLEEVLHFDL